MFFFLEGNYLSIKEKKEEATFGGKVPYKAKKKRKKNGNTDFHFALTAGCFFSLLSLVKTCRNFLALSQWHINEGRCTPD